MRRLATLIPALVLFGAGSLAAQEPGQPPDSVQPEDAILVERIEATIAAPRTAASSMVLRERQFQLREIDTPGDVLRAVPGLVIAQHAGGGKSDQYLIRGFDADHGTDFAVWFEGIPVNLVSHAHGQGYADLHFLIPETLERIEVDKGPYFVEYGDLATAGAAHLRLRERFDRPFVRAQWGNFGTGRVLAGWSPESEDAEGFLALEAYRTDGPFDDPQDLRRLNGAASWTFPVAPDQELRVFATGYDGEWNASGQIPLREVVTGRLDRFDSIDPSEGGESHRYNASVVHEGRWGSHALRTQIYGTRYFLDLLSNFTFFLNDPVNGDGIRQRDRRILAGGHSQYHYVHAALGRPAVITAGLDVRNDRATVGLFRQRERETTSTVVDSDIRERNVGVYVQEELALLPRLKAIAGLRYDRFHFDVADRGGEARVDGQADRDILQPKASLVVGPFGAWESTVYLNYGRGFHSNDARSVVADPTGVALAAADGGEIGFSARSGDRFEVSAAWWVQDLEGELVWVGDEGTTELSDPTRRHGPELEAVVRLADHVWADASLAYSWAEFRDRDLVVARSPRALWSGGVTVDAASGFAGSVRLRGIGDFPLNEEDTFEGDGYTVVDLAARQPLGAGFDLVAAVENLFDVEFKEAQTFFESRLADEGKPVADNHFNPGTPISFRIGIEIGS